MVDVGVGVFLGVGVGVGFEVGVGVGVGVIVGVGTETAVGVAVGAAVSFVIGLGMAGASFFYSFLMLFEISTNFAISSFVRFNFERISDIFFLVSL